MRSFFVAVAFIVGCLSAADAATVEESSCSAQAGAYTIAVPGRPFGIAELPSGRAAFVSVNPENPAQQAGIAVLLCRNGRFAYDHLIPLGPQPTGLAITPDGALVVAADDSFAAFVRTKDAVAGKPSIAGFFKTEDGDIEDDDAGSIFASVSPDGNFAFISEENNATLTVVDLRKGLAAGFSRAIVVGEIEVGNAPIATAFSKDGRTLYITSEISRRKYGFAAACRAEGGPPDAQLDRPPGVILSIDVAIAETNPSASVLGKVASECSPVRLSMSPDGQLVWVTNRASNSLSLFNANAISLADASAKIASVQVGSNPVPVLATSDGKYVLVGNTNRFGPGGTSEGTVSVVDTSTRHVVATYKVGAFPREFDRGVGTTIFLSNNRSDSVTIFDDRMIDGCVAAAVSECFSQH